MWHWKKRYDMLSELLESVKKYLSHEYQTLTGVTALRSGAQGEERRLDQQQGLSEEVIRSIDEEISRQTHSMDEIRKQMDRGGSAAWEATATGERDAQRREEAQKSLHEARELRGGAVNQKISALASVHRDLTGVTAGIDALYEQYPVLNSGSLWTNSSERYTIRRNTCRPPDACIIPMCRFITKRYG